MICNVYRQRRWIAGELREAESWTGRLRMDWESSISHVPLHTTDKRIAVHKLSQLADEREKERNGILAPKPVREAAERPLCELLDDYLVEVQARGRRPNTVRKYRNTLRKLFERCRWLRISDASVRSFCQWRNTAGLSGKTTNDLTAAASTFFDWLERQQMVLRNPLQHVERVDTRGRGQCRRALTEDQIRRLLEVSPRLRSVIYLTAIFTGLRRVELNNLRWGDLHLDDQQPFVLAPASITKNRKDAKLPLRPEVVQALRSILPANAAPFTWVFHGHVPRMSTLRIDLKKAGIPYADDSGRRVDFHAFRVTLATLLVKEGVPLAAIARIMRHSDPKVTLKIYTDVAAWDLSTALATLPAMNVPQLVAL